jgi:transcriptional regulator with XRE-family HTH domain
VSQAEVARQAQVTVSYLRKLETGGSAPGIDLVERLARALGTTLADLVPPVPSPDTLGVLQEQARRLFEDLLRHADRETLLMLNPLLARLGESPTRRR